MSPLANQDPLAQLNDIIAPSTPSGFPPAPIYWLLLALFFGVIIALYYVIKNNQQQRKKRRDALHTLRQLEQQQADFITLNQLLKGYALQHFQRTEVASLHGEQWFDFLQRYSVSPIFNNKQDFIARLYQGEQQAAQQCDFSDAKNWINALSKQIKKAQ